MSLAGRRHISSARLAARAAAGAVHAAALGQATAALRCAAAERAGSNARALRLMVARAPASSSSGHAVCVCVCVEHALARGGAVAARARVRARPKAAGEGANHHSRDTWRGQHACGSLAARTAAHGSAFRRARPQGGGAPWLHGRASPPQATSLPAGGRAARWAWWCAGVLFIPRQIFSDGTRRGVGVLSMRSVVWRRQADASLPAMPPSFPRQGAATSPPRPGRGAARATRWRRRFWTRQWRPRLRRL